MQSSTASPTPTVVTETPRPSVPVRVLVRMFDRYPDAADAVERLRRAGITGERVTVVGAELSWVRDADPGGAAARAVTATGAIGALVGFLTWLVGFGDAAPFILVAFGALVGAAAGTAGFLAWFHGTGDDTSVPQTGRVQAARYDLLVDEAHADRAAELLDGEG